MQDHTTLNANILGAIYHIHPNEHDGDYIDIEPAEPYPTDRFKARLIPIVMTALKEGFVQESNVEGCEVMESYTDPSEARIISIKPNIKVHTQQEFSDLLFKYISQLTTIKPYAAQIERIEPLMWGAEEIPAPEHQEPEETYTKEIESKRKLIGPDDRKKLKQELEATMKASVGAKDQNGKPLFDSETRDIALKVISRRSGQISESVFLELRNNLVTEENQKLSSAARDDLVIRAFERIKIIVRHKLPPSELGSKGQYDAVCGNIAKSLTNLFAEKLLTRYSGSQLNP